MARLSIEERLDVAIRDAAKDGDPAKSSLELAEDLYESDRALIDHFAREWIIERLSVLIRLHRSKLRAADDPQMQLGFTVPKTIVLPTGKRLPFAAATLRKIRQYRSLLWKEKRSYKHPAIQKLDRAIELMKKYVEENRGITYGEVLAKETAK